MRASGSTLIDGGNDRNHAALVNAAMQMPARAKRIQKANAGPRKARLSPAVRQKLSCQALQNQYCDATDCHSQKHPNESQSLDKPHHLVPPHLVKRLMTNGRVGYTRRPSQDGQGSHRLRGNIDRRRMLPGDHDATSWAGS
jgi:hypothetical protein